MTTTPNWWYHFSLEQKNVDVTDFQGSWDPLWWLGDFF